VIQPKITKIHFIVLAGTLFVALVAVALRIFLFGATIVYLEGEHDPVNTQVSIGGVTVFPSGDEGKTYYYNGRAGSFELVVQGPLVETFRADVDVSATDRKKYIFQIESLTAHDIFIEAAGLTGEEIIEEVLLFGESNNWIAGQTSIPSQRGSRNFTILHHSDKWQVIDSGLKLSAFEEIYENAPQKLIEYLLNEAGD
jgi:hypothetical protein